MTAPTSNPSPQWVPRNFAHGNLLDIGSNIPCIGGYVIPSNPPGGTPAPTQMLADGYFGPEQQRPSIGSGPATGTPPNHIPGNGTNSENQGNPSLGATLAFGSLIFWASALALPPKSSGYVIRVNTDPTAPNNGYGTKPGMKRVDTEGAAFV